MVDVVLLHGSTQSPAAWRPVHERLSSAGISVQTPDLLPYEDASIDETVTHLVAKLHGLDRPIVVAHSISGLYLSELAHRMQARHTIWLAAWIPDPQQSLIDEIQTHPIEIFNPDWLGADPTASWDDAQDFLFNTCPPERLPFAHATLRTFSPTVAMSERASLHDVPATYVVAEADRTLRPAWCRKAAAERLGVKATPVATDHCPHISQPNTVAQLINARASVP